MCALCGVERRSIAFITNAPTVRDILAPLDEPTAPPRVAPARGPTLGEAAGAEHEPTPDPARPPVPASKCDQRIAWSPEPPPLVAVPG